MVNFWSQVYTHPVDFYRKVDSLCTAFFVEEHHAIGCGSQGPVERGSLWVAWIRGNVFLRKSFWNTNDSPRFSRVIRSMLQLKHLLPTFLKCEIGNRMDASFWWDSWTELGPLRDFVGQRGPRMLPLSLEAKVVEAVRNGEWFLSNARSEEVQQLEIKLTGLPPPQPDRGNDNYLWRTPAGTDLNSFSSEGTWEQLRTQSPQLPWTKLVGSRRLC
ncbi:unnamed protein product [Microthlaspi erraticum]|uniref:Reverse transcriptase zinc-binding domain-containing protein n=1 Tax=Microthlaspi erraticum TaxID=1685480 RepID=A0A6D2JT47_9BRAS|nr:unnamed protein product [Microthlaspi erraticum]